MSSFTSSYAETFRATICGKLVLIRELRKDGTRTSEACSHEDFREASKTTDEGGTGDVPIVPANVVVVCVDADVHEDAKDDEDDDGGSGYFIHEFCE